MNSVFAVFLICAAVIGQGSSFELPSNAIVQKWAEELGSELFFLGENVTKHMEIHNAYKLNNVQIETKDAKTLLDEVVANVSRMLQRKIEAVQCISQLAEEAAENYEYDETQGNNFTYYSSKYSPAFSEYFEFNPQLADSIKNNSFMYLNMSLNEDTHFFDIPVNTDFSSVHVPINIYDRSLPAQQAIEWSLVLDDMFKMNYKSDPALFWQYFGTSTGILRHYPAMSWADEEVDLYDCRVRPWFIEAATCSKDVIILFDNSGSMTGMGNHIAQLTISIILDTLSNNDFVNIYTFADHTEPVVPCFNNTLVQASRENIKVFKEANKNLKPEGSADFAKGLTVAFKLLEKYRRNRDCKGANMTCNQAIMLVTDGTPGNLTGIYLKYNRRDNGTRIPVRIFTYLIGKEIPKVKEIWESACLNRGYFAHVQSLDEVTEEVFNYIPVIARPLVLYGAKHTPTWTHAYADITYSRSKPSHFQEYRLLTSLAVPAFNNKVNRDNSTRTAELLGVAGTDVPLEDIEKLTHPYKLGVNGYSFIVNNNGYVMMHPSLRPMFEGTLKENYNSVDLTEVEQFYDNLGPRVLNPDLKDLRRSLVNHLSGIKENINIKYHYDDMRRVSKQTYNYYYSALKDTPFSIGFAVPALYGTNWIKVGDELKKNLHKRVNISSFFVGDNWKIHPRWVYCKYHYVEFHDLPTPEDEWRHFMEKMSKPDWKWTQQYEELDRVDNNSDTCGKKSLGNDDYYCNEELVQRLIFDAKVTFGAFETNVNWSSVPSVDKYNVSLRFVATMSGITRWENISNGETEFGDYYPRAINEPWYKSAVLHHQVDPLAFVYSIPFDSGAAEDITVTGSHAIFPRDNGTEAAGSVVGFQFSHNSLFKAFVEITTNSSCSGCSCTSDELDCYIIDHSGFIVVSETRNDSGKFFGEIQGAVMETMHQAGLFEKITVYDLQAMCHVEDTSPSDSMRLFTPFSLVRMLLQWLLEHALLILLDLDRYVAADSGADLPEPYPCDKEMDLFVLNHAMRTSDVKNGSASCSRPFIVERIPRSNLLLIVINAMHTSCYRKFSNRAREIVYNDTEYPCYKLELNSLPRRKLSHCFSEHPLEREIQTCGRSTRSEAGPAVLYLVLLAIILKLE